MAARGNNAKKGRPMKATVEVKKQFSVRMDDHMLAVIDDLVEASEGFLADRAAVIRMAVKLAEKSIRSRIAAFASGEAEQLDPEKTPSAEELTAERDRVRRSTEAEKIAAARSNKDRPQ